MHEIWCLGSDRITIEVHRTVQKYIISETSGQFQTQYFAENGRRIPVISQISVNRSVKLLGIPADAWGCGLLFLGKVLDLTIPHCWEDNSTSNQNCPVIPGGTLPQRLHRVECGCP